MVAFIYGMYFFQVKMAHLYPSLIRIMACCLVKGDVGKVPEQVAAAGVIGER